MDWGTFISEFYAVKGKDRNYRLGQHFINTFYRDGIPENNTLLEGLYEKTGDEALAIIYEYIETNNWDYNELPVVSK